MKVTQFSDWTWPQSSHSKVFSKKLENNSTSTNQFSKTTLLQSPLSTCLFYCIVGTLINGIALAVVLTLWLTTPTISSNVSSSFITTVTTGGSVTTLTTTPGCHICNTSSYASSCPSCTTTNADCVIICLCYPISGVLKNSSLTISPGVGNGCVLDNNNGQLNCIGYCA